MRYPMSEMARDEAERDYRVGTQLELDPDSFVQVVTEAFLLEHGVSKQKDIAGVMDVHPTRVNQIFRNPAGLEAVSIRAILACLSMPANRKRVFDAWVREAFGDQVGDGWQTGRANTITEKTLRRVDRMIRESRLTAAAHLAAEVAERAEELELVEMALDRLVWCKQRLDEPGQAMIAATQITERAKERGEPGREAAGHLLRVRILLGLADCKESEVAPIHDSADRLLMQSRGAGQVKYLLATRRQAESSRRNAQILFMERGKIPVDQDHLNEILPTILRQAQTAKSHQAKYHAWQLAARIYTLLGKAFQASEAIDQAFESGSVQNLNAFEMSGLLAGRTLRRTEKPSEVVDYLLDMSMLCRKSEDRYHQRLIEWELARHLTDHTKTPHRPE
jgi:hypothetical protein